MGKNNHPEYSSQKLNKATGTGLEREVKSTDLIILCIVALIAYICFRQPEFISMIIFLFLIVIVLSLYYSAPENKRTNKETPQKEQIKSILNSKKELNFKEKIKKTLFDKKYLFISDAIILSVICFWLITTDSNFEYFWKASKITRICGYIDRNHYHFTFSFFCLATIIVIGSVLIDKHKEKIINILKNHLLATLLIVILIIFYSSMLLKDAKNSRKIEKFISNQRKKLIYSTREIALPEYKLQEYRKCYKANTDFRGIIR